MPITTNRKIPTELGTYDLRNPTILYQQSQMARQYGIYGFVIIIIGSTDVGFEKPVQQMLKSGEPDFPYCLCWANESWTRRWAGSDDEVIIHSPTCGIANL